MPVEALCPTCGAVFNLKDEFQGKKVRCKKCEQVFTVGGEAKAKEREEEEAAGVQSKASGPARKNARDDDDDDERPRRSSSRKGRDDDDDDDDDDKPRGKRKRSYADDDDDDDKPRRKKKAASGSGAMIAIIAGVAVLALALIGGGIYGVYYLLSDSDKDSDDSAEVEKDKKDDKKNQGNNNQGNPFGNNPGGNPFGNNPGFPADFGGGQQPNNLDEALANLKSGKPEQDRRAAANWLARQPLDVNRQKETAKALEPLVGSLDPNTCEVGARALVVWGTINNGPALTAALQQKPTGGIPGGDIKGLIAALAQIKYEPGAAQVARFLNHFTMETEVDQALDKYGPVAEKAVLAYYHDQDGGKRDRARRLISRYGTKAGAILDQTVADLGAADQGRVRAATEWLSRTDSDFALQAAKAEPARRTAVALALNRIIEGQQGFSDDTVIAAARRWATKDNVSALLGMMSRSAFKKQDIGNVLIAIGPDCQEEVSKTLATSQNRDVVDQCERVMAAITGGKGDYKITKAINALKATDAGGFNRMRDAGNDLQRIPVDDKKRPEVVAALLGAFTNTGPVKADFFLVPVAKATAIWATKDDAPMVVERLKDMKTTGFCGDTRKILMQWLGTAKAEKGIPFLVAAVVTDDERQTASRALQAMGPDLGPSIELELAKVTANDKNTLIELIKIYGAVGTKGSINLLKAAAARNAKDQGILIACQEAITAITLRGK